MSLLTFLLMTAIVIGSKTATGAEFYTAAIYEHADAFLSPLPNATSQETAMKVMNKNLDVLEVQAGIANTQNADIFVFPEYGISGRLVGLLDTSAYLEMIPDPLDKASFCPCTKDYIQKGQEVLYRLSCIALNNSMYIAANMGDKKPCLSRTDVDCPLFGEYRYNTEVVFDKRGCLVAKYHKEHLFESEKLIWNKPKQTEFSYFDTDFGRFGLMICFDAVFKSPAIDLVEKYNVTDIIFSTAWMNVFPHYVSVGYHSGWARTMRVNYLASNIHYVPLRLVGSGIYGPEGILNYTFGIDSSSGALVVAQVPLNKRHELVYSTRGSVNAVGGNANGFFYSTVFGDEYKFTELTGLQGNTSVCYGSVCCHLEFSRSHNSELYALGAFNSMHTIEGEYFLEVCLLVRCSDERAKCGTTITSEAVTEFHSYTLTGKMDTKYAFPEVLTTDLNFTTDWEFFNEGSTKTIRGSKKKISAVVLMGRNFDKDSAVTATTPGSTAPSQILNRLLLLVTTAAAICFGLM